MVKNALHAYADDISTWQAGTCWQKMKIELEHISKTLQVYLAYKGLKINAIKCQLAVFGKQFLTDVQNSDLLSIDFLGMTIIEKSEFKLLGVTIDNKLSFSTHISNTVAKCLRNLAFLWRTAAGFKFEHRKMLACAIVCTHLDYCSSVYHLFLSKHDSKKIESALYKIMRFICASKRSEYTPAHVFRQKLHWDTACHRRLCKLMSITWSAVYSESSPKYMDCLIKHHSVYNTRFQSRSQSYNNKFSRMTLNFFFCDKFIKLPRLVLNSHSVELFKQRLKAVKLVIFHVGCPFCPHRRSCGYPCIFKIIAYLFCYIFIFQHVYHICVWKFNSYAFERLYGK